MLSRTVNTNIFKNLIFVTQNKRPKARTKIFELITGSSNIFFFSDAVKSYIVELQITVNALKMCRITSLYITYNSFL